MLGPFMHEPPLVVPSTKELGAVCVFVDGLATAPTQNQKPAVKLVQSYANGLTVSADASSADLTMRSTEFRGHVVATYGPTTVTADHLTYRDDPEDPFAEATGNVRLVDPEGIITASHLLYRWKEKTGSAENVFVQASLLALSAESVDLKPNLWVLRNVGATGCKLKVPLYYIHTPELQIRPGVGIRAIHPDISLFGQKVLTLPNRNYQFNSNTASIDVPYPGIRSGGHAGVTWTNEFALDQESGLFTRVAFFSKNLPYYSAAIMRSAIKDRDPETVRTELSDRFTFGYFDSVRVRDPKSEQDYFKTTRLDFGLSSSFGDDGRDTTTDSAKVNKPIEVLGQATGDVKGFGAFALFRAQEVRVGTGGTIQRLILEQNLLTPSVPIGKDLAVFARADLAEFMGGNRYGWIRGQAGAVFQPTSYLRLGASYTSARDHGTPDFAYDTPFRFHEVNLRADLDFDTTQFRVLFKYDPSQRSIYDHEFYVSKVIGCIEPFIAYRERPHKLLVGLKLPVSRLFGEISKAAAERQAAIRTTISGPPDK